ncbi:MAG: hypothetical protein KHX26_11320 [Burkholderiales bacterium]|nr:hypothetical protein [Burkholderiales bacterium]
MMEYSDFLKTKSFSIAPVGKKVNPSEINSRMFSFQRDIVLWALQDEMKAQDLGL